MKMRILSLCISLVMLLALLGSVATMPATAATIAPTIMGDLDGDSDLTTTDARLYLKKLIAGGTFTGTDAVISDLTADGEFGTSDVRTMVTLVLQKETPKATRAIWVPYMEVGSLLSSGNITTAKAAIDACLQDCADRGANVVYFHVRANSDAYYASSLFDYNWSAKTLINNGFDPLTYAVESAHAKGMELHAWVNPYRIGSDASYAKADAVFYKGNKYYYLPSDAAVQELVVSGVRELVENYDIDGVQFDDYFYPTGLMNADAPEDFEAAGYAASGNGMSIGDWRRAAVNRLLAACYEVCHSREGCVFGISPSYDFASNYDDMYADAATWAKTPGYVDYLAPQLYIGFNHIYSPFDKAIESWQTLPRLSTVDMIAGLALYKTGLLDDTWAGATGKTEWATNDDIMSRQIAMTKALDWDGVALYSHQSFEVGSDRDATVANADMAAACRDWLVFE